MRTHTMHGTQRTRSLALAGAGKGNACPVTVGRTGTHGVPILHAEVHVQQDHVFVLQTALQRALVVAFVEVLQVACRWCRVPAQRS